MFADVFTAQNKDLRHNISTTGAPVAYIVSTYDGSTVSEWRYNRLEMHYVIHNLLWLSH